MGLGGVISNLLSLGDKLLPTVIASAQSSSSSSSPGVDQNHQIEVELKKLMRMLERIKATLYDAEQREITDSSVKLWLKELKSVAYDAEDVLGEYHYEVLRAQVEERDASPQDSHKGKLIQVPNGILNDIQQIRSRFDEITNDRIALQLSEGDGPKRCNNELQRAPISHFVVQANIIGREREKEKLIELLSSERDVVSVVAIVGMGGIGKTTLAQLVYNDQRIQQRFEKCGWICVSEGFNVARLTRESMESITRKECGLTNLSALQENIRKEISGKRILLVLDDVWNENDNLWDSFKAPFMSAAFAKILVTTRNDPVARIMQTEPTFNLGSLSAEQCWLMFEHYAFSGVEKKDSMFVKIGKQIMDKCGMLPLAVKSIASLLRYEAEEESWRDILESELWESDARNEIFPPLQISYARLPTYLKSCFLYCSIFPKDHIYDVEYLVKLWMYQGFIEPKGNKTAQQIGFEYVEQLCQRSLFQREGRYERNVFKLHDIVHDLARYNSENGCYSMEASKVPIFPSVLYHLYIAHYDNLIDPIPSNKLIALRTLIIVSSTFNNSLSTFDLSMAPKLRTLEIWGSNGFELESLPFFGNFKHLRYISFTRVIFNVLPECICSLYTLKNLTLRKCHLEELPKKIGNLISLEELIIDKCHSLALLPESLCQLTALRKLFIKKCHEIKELPSNIGMLVSLGELQIEHCCGLQVVPGSLCQLKALQKLCLIHCYQLEELPSDMGSLTNLETLEINHTGVSYLPPSMKNIVGIQAVKVELKCETIGWLKDFPDLGGTLRICGLGDIPNLMDVQCANLVSMHNLEHLILEWSYMNYTRDSPGTSVLGLVIEWDKSILLEDQSCFSVMDSLHPHPNLTKLQISSYNGITFPEWIGSLCKLKYLKITSCHSLQFLKAELLPLELEELDIDRCHQLVSIPGIQKLKSLVKLSIDNCENLCSFMEPSLELTMGAREGSSGSSLLGLRNLASLRSLKISNCLKLKVLVDELLPVEPCKVEVTNCPGLLQWCRTPRRRGPHYRDAILVIGGLFKREALVHGAELSPGVLCTHQRF
ncbi:putative disease resistance RPP13-like protein 1 [Carex rostrata]